MVIEFLKEKVNYSIKHFHKKIPKHGDFLLRWSYSPENISKTKSLVFLFMVNSHRIERINAKNINLGGVSLGSRVPSSREPQLHSQDEFPWDVMYRIVHSVYIIVYVNE